ncbi:MAG TPA: flagellin hook IN motif-containing protein, partial [Candidatus Wallbacteria bacterium]|nr:flagellin hook IN motif-containing protein [Candidatus Wallbacteria bacterium]
SGATLINDVAYNGDRSEIRMNESESSKIVSNINGETAFMNVTRQSVYSTKAFGDINRAPAMDNLKPGYFTIKGRGYEEIVKIDGGESLQAIADKINKGSQIAYAKIIEDKGAYRFVLEAREKGAANQFALIEGATGFERARTNFLEAAGLNSKVEFAGAGVADPGSSLAFQLNDIKNGNFYINGRLIKVDVNKDSLNDIAKKINDGVKNVYAKVSKGSDGLSRLSLEGAGSLIVENDTSGLMEKLGLARSRYKSTAVIADAFVSAQPLSKNEWVKNGNFKINNVNVGIVDAASETLETIKDRINGIAGINATASIEGGRFVISAGNPPDPSSRLSNITDGTSEFIKSFEFSYQGKDLGAAVTENSSVVGTLGVAAGSRFAINGKEFSVDAADTLKTLMEKINSSNIGVMASFNGGRFELSPLGNKESLNLNNFSDVTGDFFSKI